MLGEGENVVAQRKHEIGLSVAVTNDILQTNLI